MTKISVAENLTAIRFKNQTLEPTNPPEGYTVMFVEDGGVYVKNSEGTVIGPFGETGGPQVTGGIPLPTFTKPPALSSLTWINQGTASAEEVNNGLYLSIPAGATENNHALVEAVPATPYNFTVGFIPQLNGQSNHIGLCLRANDGKMVNFFCLYGAGGYSLHCTSYSSATAGVSDYFNVPPVNLLQFVYLRIRDDAAGNRIFSWSLDGLHFLECFRHASTTYITPTQIGIVGSANSASAACGMMVYHYEKS